MTDNQEDMTLQVCYYLKLWLKGIPEEQVFRLSKEEQERFSRCYGSDDPDDPDSQFVWLPTLEGTDVVISLRDVQAAHMLFQGEMVPRKLSDDETDRSESPGVKIWLRGRGIAIDETFSEAVEAHELFLHFDACFHATDPVASFMDMDGEVLSVDSRHVVMIEAGSKYLEDGYAEWREKNDVSEDEEGAAKTSQESPPEQEQSPSRRRTRRKQKA